jgi:ERCC4-type nuclease
MPSDELLYQIGLTLINGIGDGHAKNLLAYCGSAGAVFEANKKTLLKIPGVGEFVANALLKGKDVLLKIITLRHYFLQIMIILTA